MRSQVKGVNLLMNGQHYSDEITSDHDRYSFVVHIWKEMRSSEKDQQVWRGHITSIPNGEGVYFSDVGEISNIILSYIKSGS